MMNVVLLCALTLNQPPERADWQLTPQLAPGLELVYSGIYVDESLIPGAHHQRQYRLDTHVLVLDSGLKDWHVAIMTGLSLLDVKQPSDKKPLGPTSVRLSQARIDWQGKVRTLEKKLFEIPLNGPATLETGLCAPVPLTKVGRNHAWDIAEPDQPVQKWKVVGSEACGGVTCIKLTGTQQSDDWDRGRADKSAWRRRDVVWLHPQLLVAQKVERVIEQRAPARETATSRHLVRYELDSHIRYPGRSFDDRRDEALKASKFHDDAQALIRLPVLPRNQVDSLIQRVAYHLDHPQSQQTTPYRKAVAHVKTVLERVKQGDVPAPPVIDDGHTGLVKPLDVGQRATDFAVSSLTEEKATQLKSYAGKPIVVVFYNPSTQLGREVVTFAKKLSEKQPDRVGIMAMAVTDDAEVARKQHQDLRLPFPILDGNGMRLTFGASETPRFLVLDGAGVVRLAETGWGYHTPVVVSEMVERCRK